MDAKQAYAAAHVTPWVVAAFEEGREVLPIGNRANEDGTYAGTHSKPMGLLWTIHADAVVDVRFLVEITGSTRVLPVSRSRQTAA
jgi:hypothetical protein